MWSCIEGVLVVPAGVHGTEVSVVCFLLHGEVVKYNYGAL